MLLLLMQPLVLLLLPLMQPLVLLLLPVQPLVLLSQPRKSPNFALDSWVFPADTIQGSSALNSPNTREILGIQDIPIDPARELLLLGTQEFLYGKKHSSAVASPDTRCHLLQTVPLLHHMMNQPPRMMALRRAGLRPPLDLCQRLRRTRC